MGVATGTVYNYLKKYGIKTRKKLTIQLQKSRGRHGEKSGRKKMGCRLSEQTKLKISESRRMGGIGHKKNRCDGYIYVYFPDHPKSSKEGYIMEHILVMEALIGRHLNDNECVHHIDGNKRNNKKENLKLMTKSEHMSYHSQKRHNERRNGLSM